MHGKLIINKLDSDTDHKCSTRTYWFGENYRGDSKIEMHVAIDRGSLEVCITGMYSQDAQESLSEYTKDARKLELYLDEETIKKFMCKLKTAVANSEDTHLNKEILGLLKSPPPNAIVEDKYD